MDAVEPERLGPWLANVLGLGWQPATAGAVDAGAIVGPTPGHTVLLMAVAEPKSVKHRVHLDIYTRALADLQALGSVVVEPQHADWRWTIMADPEGGEFCAFLRDELPADRLHGLVVDSENPLSIATWWAKVLGGDLVDNDAFCTVENIPGMPILTMDFVPVPEPKTVKNRIHWDVAAPDVGDLVAAGGVVLRHPDEEIHWTVMADPEGNEFCVFRPEP